MTKNPKNIFYKIFDLSTEGTTHKYLSKNLDVRIEELEQNHRIIKDISGADEVCFVKQIHSNVAIYSSSAFKISEEPEADAIYTDKKGVALSIWTADCVPVLIYSEDSSIIGAAHCGWKGAITNILDNLHQKMSEKASKFYAIIGPSIIQKSYEVDIHYRDNFLKDDPDNAKFFIDSVKPLYFLFDIAGYVKAKLEKLNIEIAHHITEDTYSTKLPSGNYKYPSYRRFCHINDLYPRNLVSTIMIKK
ncbi:MAG UNVERIFIED_CONTAM: polyphenol oxidase family protein [Rickettsiaceae bacterium]|jgi:YfiH family protein